MPAIGHAHVQCLIDSFEPTNLDCVIASGSHVVRSPPALFAIAHLATLAGIVGDSGAKALLIDAKMVEANADKLIDIDTPEDLARAKARADRVD
jgi:molybdenum cofactor cytidylyltransferase